MAMYIVIVENLLKMWSKYSLTVSYIMVQIRMWVRLESVYINSLIDYWSLMSLYRTMIKSHLTMKGLLEI